MCGQLCRTTCIPLAQVTGATIRAYKQVCARRLSATGALALVYPTHALLNPRCSRAVAGGQGIGRCAVHQVVESGPQAVPERTTQSHPPDSESRRWNPVQLLARWVADADKPERSACRIRAKIRVLGFAVPCSCQCFDFARCCPRVPFQPPMLRQCVGSDRAYTDRMKFICRFCNIADVTFPVIVKKLLSQFVTLSPTTPFGTALASRLCHPATRQHLKHTANKRALTPLPASWNEKPVLGRPQLHHANFKIGHLQCGDRWTVLPLINDRVAMFIEGWGTSYGDLFKILMQLVEKS